VLLVGGTPVALAVWILTISESGHSFAVDFVNSFWPAGHHVLHGQSPFPPVTHAALARGTAFVYPAPAALLVAPFALLPVTVAAALFTAFLAASALLALYAVGVRDWRCYSTIFLWWPVLAALQTANLTLLLTLGAALVWRYRDRRAVGYAAGAVLAFKLFLWPLVIWLFATRRYAAGLRALAVAVVLTFASWAALGFAGLTDYLPALRLLTRLEEQASYTPLAIGVRLGLDLSSARALGLVISAAALGGLIWLARKRRDDERSFVLALAAGVLLSPVVWIHYFALFIVALGLLRPHYGRLWLVPFVAFGPIRPSGPTWWAIPVLAIFAALLTIALARSPEERRARSIAPRLAGAPGCSPT